MIAGTPLRFGSFAGRLSIVSALALFVSNTLAGAQAANAAATSATAEARADSTDETTTHESLFGRSGKLRFIVSNNTPAAEIPTLAAMFGDSAVRTPGVYSRADSAGNPLALFTLLPFSNKAGGRVGAYRVGFWPAERRRIRSAAYENPDGFIVVTEDNQDTYVSEHFQLRDFLTHDQRDVWPKYLILREELVDKLELLIADLQDHGIPVSHMSVLSGFRTPQYNVRGVGRGGRALDSRHQYGDAADVFIDNNGDGRMDDLNHDKRVNSRDVRLITDAIDRVETAYPDLVGGMGLYRATKVHGPFVHVDVRGQKARWGRA